MTTRVILVRHGRSTYNELGLYQGSCDESFLTVRGIETATLTGEYLAQFPIAAIYTSPLQRARQTAELLAQEHPKVPPSTIADALREIDLPEWQGLAYQFVREQYADRYHCWKEMPHAFTMESGTFYPVISLFDRARAFWRKVLPHHVNQTILVVSHGGTIQALIATALGLGPKIFHRFQQSNCGVSTLTFPPGVGAGARLEFLNLTHHLEESLPKLKEGKRGLRQVLWACEADTESMKSTLLKQQNDYPVGVQTEIQACTIAHIHDRLKSALGITFPPQLCDIQLGGYCIFHQPKSLQHTIIQAINWPTIPL